MDTKLKKSHKLITIIITLCILIPAFLITALYPQIGREMQKLDKEYNEMVTTEEGEFIWELQDNFINYAMEASYHIYGEMLVEAGEGYVNFGVLDYAGWTNDYYALDNQVRYHATYQHGDETTGTTNSAEKWETEDTVAMLTLTFDSRGNLSMVDFEGANFEDVSVQELREQAQKSFEQYNRNVLAYEEEYGVEVDDAQLIPKNFTVKYAMDEQCDFLYGYEWGPHRRSTEGLLYDTGAIWIMLVGIGFVAFAALILPFFRRLNTGWEKMFSMPFEIVCGLGVGTVFAFIGMFYAMGASCRLIDYPKIEVIGTVVPEHIQFAVLLASNLIGWGLCFFAEYIVIAAVRQLICRPIYYMKNRFLLIILFQWVKRKCIKIYQWVYQVDVTGKVKKIAFRVAVVVFGGTAIVYSVVWLILAIVVTNYFWLDGFWYMLWFLGILLLAVCAFALYILIIKFGAKLQMQYISILTATNQMAEGNLKISLAEELGVFRPIGDSLEKVQQGFHKAVVEEAKSHNMKTELITNVSHDLKTPLTAIITYIDLLKKEGVTEEERKSYIDTLDKKSQRLKALIEDLFEVSKAQSGNVQMNYMDVDIVSLLKQVKSEMEEQLEESNLTFRWNLPEEKVVLSLDGQRTYRVFENLINNALKYSMPYSRVYIDIVDSERDVQIIFKNTSAQELDFDPERLTERFVRGDAARKSEGSGLGLAIAKSFVELQNGKFRVEVDGDLFKVIIAWNK